MATVINTVGLERAAVVVKDDISHIAVGTGSTAPTIAEVKLVTETVRDTPNTKLTQGKVIQIRTHFTNAQLPTTAEEFGCFMNGSGTADSGELLSRNTSQFVKGSDDLLFIFEITLA